MQSAWNDRDAEAAVACYENLGRDLALRVYTTRLLGKDPRLVLHGGGNTSVKMRLSDLNGDAVEVLCVKGSGRDMGSIEPAGLPAVRLAPLLKLRRREKLSDEEMVRLQRANLVRPGLAECLPPRRGDEHRGAESAGRSRREREELPARGLAAPPHGSRPGFVLPTSGHACLLRGRSYLH